MTHPKEAVKTLAAALWLESEGEGSHGLYEGQHYDGAVTEYEAKATALLDQIAPHYREQAAEKVDARRAKVLAALSKAIPRSAQFYSLRNKDEALEDVAAAIRKGE